MRLLVQVAPLSFSSQTGHGIYTSSFTKSARERGFQNHGTNELTPLYYKTLLCDLLVSPQSFSNIFPPLWILSSFFLLAHRYFDQWINLRWLADDYYRCGRWGKKIHILVILVNFLLTFSGANCSHCHLYSDTVTVTFKTLTPTTLTVVEGYIKLTNVLSLRRAHVFSSLFSAKPI